MLRRILTAPWRFFVWLTTDTGRRRVSMGEMEVHRDASVIGHDLGRHREAEDLQRDTLGRHRRASDESRRGADD